MRKILPLALFGLSFGVNASIVYTSQAAIDEFWTWAESEGGG